MVIALFLIVIILLAATIMIVMRISGQMNERLSQMNSSIGASLTSASGMFGGVHEKLGKLEVTNQQIMAISKDIASLQELLRAPKFRGSMGETMLENLLSQVLPKEFYDTQYRFKSADAVDAVIRLGERLVPVDAKFSLENFQKMQAVDDEQQRMAFRKKFIQDTKARVDEIASKYILPQENTYDFALMYIPAENVYYEITVKEDLMSYFLSKKVVPVSPNTFYAYLQIICLGLKGMKIEENATVILKNLSGLGIEIAKIKDDFALVGSHLMNAAKKYDDTQKRIDKFQDKFLSIQDTKQLEG